MLPAENLLKNFDIKIVILSSGRSNFIAEKTCQILPNYITVLVPESQKKDYAEKIKNPIDTVPDNICGLGMLRNWVINNYPQETVIMIDDDISMVYYLGKELSERIEDPDKLVQILINTAIMAKDAGTNVFSFKQADIRKYKAHEPFSLNTWGGCVVGVIGKGLQFIDNKLKVDVDFFLQNLLINRIVWIDNRYYCDQAKDCNTGGNAAFRNKKTFQEEIERLKAKWGKYFCITYHDKNVRTNIRVARKQKGIII